jgi:hypothetical protein
LINPVTADETVNGTKNHDWDAIYEQN